MDFQVPSHEERAAGVKSPVNGGAPVTRKLADDMLPKSWGFLMSKQRQGLDPEWGSRTPILQPLSWKISLYHWKGLYEMH